MPLSEDEQRILRQIEEQLQRDPRFGREIATIGLVVPEVRRDRRRRLGLLASL